MSEDEDYEGEEFFKKDELVLVSLKDGTHFIGEYQFESDAGVCLVVTSQTSWKPVEEVNAAVIYIRGREPADPRGIPYLRELKRAIRKYIPWHRIDEIAAAQEVYEEMQLKAFADSFDLNFMDTWKEGPKNSSQLINPLDDERGVDLGNDGESGNWDE